MTWSIIQDRSTLKTKLNCYDWTNKIRSMTKTKQDNDVSGHIGILYPEIRTELWRPIRKVMVNHEN